VLLLHYVLILFVIFQNDGVDWILHLDTDELVHPAGIREYSLREVLLNVPSDVDMVVFSNYVSSVTFILKFHQIHIA